MYRGFKISVAMATYNGESFIKQQIESICMQSIKPDEIIISDDGSRDNTIDIIESLKDDAISNNVNILILKDNPRKGYCGNFEWALKHTTGDIIFVCDQDDVWHFDKIEKIANIFLNAPETECVIHEAILIDQNNKEITGVFNRWTKENLIDKGVSKLYKLDQRKYLENAVSMPLANGMVLCISRKLLESSIPFPKSTGSHDQWLIFVAISDDHCLYTPEILTFYRLHGNNTCGNSAKKEKLWKHVKRVKQRLKASEIVEAANQYYLGEAFIRFLEEHHNTDSDAYKTAKRVYEIGEKELQAVRSGRIRGSLLLMKLFKSDIRYRLCGTGAFVYQLIRIILYSKKKRIFLLRDMHIN